MPCSDGFVKKASTRRDDCQLGAGGTLKERTVPGTKQATSRPVNRPTTAKIYSLEGPRGDDAQLIDRIAAGDRTAFTMFYDRHAARILGLLVRQLRHRADAEDILQETFQQVWRSGHQYCAQRSSPEVWLVMIARSRLLDYLRRRRPDATGSLLQAEAPYRDPLMELARDESADRVRSALAKLPDNQRTVILLSFFTGLTHQEVAERQAIPLGTAKTRILLGIRSLRKSLSVLEEAAIP